MKYFKVWFLKRYIYICIVLFVATQYGCMYAVLNAYRIRGYAAFGGEWLLPAIAWAGIFAIKRAGDYLKSLQPAQKRKIRIQYIDTTKGVQNENKT